MRLGLLFLVRHGVTAYNHEGRYQGQRDVPLSPEGEIQARRLAARLHATPFDAVWSSDLARARDTAAAVVAAAGGPGLRTEPGFREMDYGLWEGLTFREAAAAHPAAWRDYQQGGDEAGAPGGETIGQVAGRARAAFDRLWDDGYDRVLLVAHGAVLKLLLLDLIGADRGLRRHMVIDNCSLTLLRYGGRARPRILTLNDTCHLEHPDRAGGLR
jgi:broad specificity phosphatase PhoE